MNEPSLIQFTKIAEVALRSISGQYRPPSSRLE